MDKQGILLLIRLLIAHVLTDFVFQTNTWVRHKKEHGARSKHLYWHVMVAAVLSYLLAMQWSKWYIPLVILITHYLIDLWKLKQRDNMFYFLADQLLHLTVIVILWLAAGSNWDIFWPWVIAVMSNYRMWLVLLGFLFVVFPTQYILIYSTKKWSDSFNGDPDVHTLKDAGKWIGIFERILVLLSILSSQYEAIGFLIAAKSFIRFSERERKTRAQTEYILIGTLISFTIAILTGIVIRLSFNYSY